jgi:hypothetical protein
MCASHLAVTSVFNHRTGAGTLFGARETAPHTHNRRSTSSTYLQAGRTVEPLSGRLCIGSNRTLYASGTSGSAFSFQNLLSARSPLVGVRPRTTRSNVRASIEGQESENSRGTAPRKKGTGKWQITRLKANDPRKWSADLPTSILADLIRGHKESKTVASVLEVHREAITAQCVRDLLKELEQSKHPRVALEVKQT